MMMTAWFLACHFDRLRTKRLAFVCLLYCSATLSDLAGAAATALPKTSEAIDYGVSFNDVLSLPGTQAGRLVSYGNEALQTFVHDAPAGDSKAEILLIHGGCWSNAYSRDHLLPLASALVSAGYSVWLPEYRRVGDVGGGWPGSFADVKAALAFVAIETEGPLIIMGHSAGGHLALLASQETTPHLDGVLALAPITNLGVYGAQEGSCQAMVGEFLGESVEQLPNIYQTASVMPSRVSAPAVLLLGTEDPIIGLDQLAGFPPEQVRLVSGAGHFDLIHPDTAAFAIVLEVLETFTRAGDPM
jgi:acetyl esterase/lipase